MVVDVDMLLSVVDVLSLPETRAIDSDGPPAPTKKPWLGGLAFKLVTAARFFPVVPVNVDGG